MHLKYLFHSSEFCLENREIEFHSVMGHDANRFSQSVQEAGDDITDVAIKLTLML